MSQFLIAQISDMHVLPEGRLCYGHSETNAKLRACIDAILALPVQPDLVLATGDLVQGGGREQYQCLREILAPLPMPCYVAAGNHDDRAELKRAFADHRPMASHLPADNGFLQYVIEDWPVRIVVLDTLLPGHDSGALCAERLAWLAETLAAGNGRPTVVAMHHPPFRCGIGFMDDLGLDGAAPLAAVIARYPNVERVLCGHVHRAIQTRFAGTIASTCPSTAHQISLDLRDAAKATYMLEPPGFQLHRWTANDGLVTHTASVGQHPGPFPFFA